MPYLIEMPVLSILHSRLSRDCEPTRSITRERGALGGLLLDSAAALVAPAPLPAAWVRSYLIFGHRRHSPPKVSCLNTGKAWMAAHEPKGFPVTRPRFPGWPVFRSNLRNYDENLSVFSLRCRCFFREHPLRAMRCHARLRGGGATDGGLRAEPCWGVLAGPWQPCAGDPSRQVASL